MPTTKSDILFQAVCKEKHGDFIRTVRPMKPVASEVNYVFAKLRGLPSMFSSVPMEDVDPIWYAVHHNWDLWMVDTVGILGVGQTWIQGYIDVHITFWDRVLRGREALCREAAFMARTVRAAKGVYTVLPASSAATIAFAKRVGFEIVAWNLKSAHDKYGRVEDAVVMEFVTD